MPKGRHQEADAVVGCLGLVLHWYRTRHSVAISTAIAFGLTASPIHLRLRFSRRVILSIFQNDPHGEDCPPTPDKIKDYTKAISARYPALGNKRVWAAADSLKVLLQKSSNWFMQNQLYNGRTANTYIKNVFVFAPDGRIQMCTINAPGI